MLVKTFNYLIKIEYDGTKFVGWQYQKNGMSVQEKIEKALSKIFKSKVKINGAGRTDKGVHALGQYANFKIEQRNSTNIKNKNHVFHLPSNTNSHFFDVVPLFYFIYKFPSNILFFPLPIYEKSINVIIQKRKST